MNQEHILVVKRMHLFPETSFQGLSTHTQTILDTITRHQEFKLRPAMEEDPTYKQIIPYLVFKHADRYFLMQRKATSSEQRLKNKYSLGIGGHMRQEDMKNSATIFDWAQREFEEEISYQGTVTVSTLGVLNDDSTPVGQVHLGLVLLLEGSSPDIKVRSELKSGHLLTVSQCHEFYPDMETWSQIIFDTIISNNQISK